MKPRLSIRRARVLGAPCDLCASHVFVDAAVVRGTSARTAQVQRICSTCVRRLARAVAPRVQS